MTEEELDDLKDCYNRKSNASLLHITSKFHSALLLSAPRSLSNITVHINPRGKKLGKLLGIFLHYGSSPFSTTLFNSPLIWGNKSDVATCQMLC